MGRIIAAINMTLDGYCDHTAVIADEDLHNHYSELLKTADSIIYGRITYQLMEFWRDLAEKPSGEKDMDDFAEIMNAVPKIVFSRTLKEVDWKSARLSKLSFEEEVREQKRASSGNVFIGSPSLITEALRNGLVDEFQLCVHPVIAGSGRPLFTKNDEKITLKLLKTKSLKSGAVVFYYQPGIK